MDEYLPKNCIISIAYLKGISKEDIIRDQWFDVDNAAGEPVFFQVEKKAKKFCFRDKNIETTFGSWKHVAEDAQKILGEDPETIRQVLSVAGVGDDDGVYDDFEVVQIDRTDTVFVASSESFGGVGIYGLASLPKRRLEKSLAVRRAVVIDWDDDQYLFDDGCFDDDLECLYFIFPENGDIDFTQEDIDIYKELADQDYQVAQYLLGVEYKVGFLSEEQNSQLLAEQWLRKAIENGSNQADRLLNGNSSDGTEGGDNDLSYPEYAWQYQDDTLLRQTADLDIDDCLVEIKLRDNLNKEEELFTQEQFSLNDQPVTFQVYKHDGQLGLVQNNEVQYFNTEAEFVAACLRETGDKLKVMTVVQGLAFCGLIDYWTAFDGKSIIGALGTKELNLFEDYGFNRLSRISSFSLYNGFAVSRQVAPKWEPDQSDPKFDQTHDLIAVVVDEYNATTLFKDEWETLQELAENSNPNAMLALAQIYYYGDLGESDLDKAEDFAQQALQHGCKRAQELLDEIKEARECCD